MPKQWLAFILSFTLFTGVATANPVGGVVTSGSAAITQTLQRTTINQTTQKSIINWQSFNINKGETTHFQQPKGGITLNRISPTQGASKIYGVLSATGKIILVNQSGVYFGPGAYVNVGGIMVSTADITDENFLAGKYLFNQRDANFEGSIVNQGTINAKDYGLVALLGNGVSNEGVINARMGHVVLASGNKFTVNLAGDNLISFTVDEEATKSGVTNSGSVFADGGKINMSARTASHVLDNAINMSGVARANSVSAKNGVIILSGGSSGVVKVSGKIMASGKIKNTKGGKIKVLGDQINIAKDAMLDASGDTGGGEVLIGGNWQGSGDEQHANYSYFDKDATADVSAITSGNGGKFVLWSDGATQFYGNVSAKGGALGGNGGMVETSGHYLDILGGKVNTTAAKGTTGLWLLDSANVTINNTFTGDVTLNNGTISPNSGISDSYLFNDNLISALSTSNITVTTTNTGTSGGGDGNINIIAPIGWLSATSLTLKADNNIYINADISGSNSLSRLILNAKNDVFQDTSSHLSGGMALIKQGNGRLTLSGDNSGLTGDIRIEAGIVRAESVNALGSTSKGTTVVAGTLEIANASSTPLNEPIFLNGSGFNNNGALLSLNGVNTLYGLITLNSASTISVDDGSALQILDIASNGKNLTLDGPGNGVIINSLNLGAGTLTKNNNSIWYIIKPANVLGATTINKGVLTLNETGAINSSSITINKGGKLTLDNSSGNYDRISNTTPINMNGGELSFIGYGAPTDSTETVGELVLKSGYSTITMTAGGGDATANILTFASLNRSAGATVLFRGIDGLDPSGATSNIRFTSVPTNLLIGSGPLGDKFAPILPFAVGDTSNSGRGANFVTYDDSNPNNSIGLRLLSASEQDTNPTQGANIVVNSDILDLPNGSYNSILMTNIAGITNNNGFKIISGAIFSTGPSNLIDKYGQMTFIREAIITAKDILQINGTINTPSVSIGVTKSGLGDLILTGTNTYTALTTVTAGTLKIGDGTIFGSINSNIVNDGKVTFDKSNDMTFTKNITGTGQVLQTGTGILTLAGANTYSGNTTINAGTLNIKGILRSDIINNAELQLSNGGIFENMISGSGNVTKLETNELTLTGVNTYTGLTEVANGVLVFSKGGSSANSSGFVVNPNTKLILDNIIINMNDRLNPSSTLIMKGGELILKGNNTVNSSQTFDVINLNTHHSIVTIITGLTKSSTLTFNNISRNPGSTVLFRGTNLGLNQANSARIVFNGGLNLIGNDHAGFPDMWIVPYALGDKLSTGTGTDFVTYVNSTDGLRLLTASEYSTNFLQGNVKVLAGNTITPIATPTINSLLLAGGTLNFGTSNETISLDSGLIAQTTGGNITGAGTLNFSGIEGVIIPKTSLSIAPIITGSAGLTKSGGTLILTGNNTYSGFTTNNNGNLQMGNGGTNGFFDTNIDNYGNLLFNRSDSVTFNSNIFGTGTLTKLGGGILTLGGNAFYYGLTTISAGTLEVKGVLDSNVLNNGIIKFNESTDYYYNKTISGIGKLDKSGSTRLILAGMNTYTGATIINSGILNVSQIGNAGMAGNLGKATALASNLVLAGGTLQYEGPTASTNRAFTLATGTSGNLGITYYVNLTFTGINSGAGNLVKNGVGTLTLSGANTYTGSTTVDEGSLVIAGSVNSNIVNNSVVEFNRSVAGTFSKMISGGSLIKSGAGALTLTNENNSLGTITVNGGNLVFSGNGVAGNTANVTINSGGKLTIDNSVLNTTRIGNANLTLNGGEFIFKGGNSGDASLGLGQLSLSSGASTITVISGSLKTATLTFNGITRDTGATILFRGNNLGSSALTNSSRIFIPGIDLVGSNTTPTNKPIVPYAMGDTSAIGTGSSFVTYNIEPNSNGTNTDIGIRPLTNNEYALNTLSSNNNIKLTVGTTAAIADTTTINSLLLAGGTLNFGPPTTDSGTTVGISTGAIAQTTGGNITISGSSNFVRQLDMSNGAYLFVKLGLTIAPVIVGSSLAKSGTAALTLAGQNTYSGTTTINQGSLMIKSDNGSNSLSTANIVNYGALQFNHTTNINYNGQITGTGTLTKLGSGTLTLTGDSSYTGVTTISAGSLQIGDNTNTGSLTSDIINNATLIFNRNDSYSFNNIISGLGKLYHSGTGTFTPNGLNTYTGATIVNNGGTLRVAFITNGGIASNIGKATSAASNIVISGGSTFEYDGGTTSTNRAFTLTNSTIDVEYEDQTLTIIGSGSLKTGIFTKTGPGILKLLGVTY